MYTLCVISTRTHTHTKWMTSSQTHKEKFHMTDDKHSPATHSAKSRFSAWGHKHHGGILCNFMQKIWPAVAESLWTSGLSVAVDCSERKSLNKRSFSCSWLVLCGSWVLSMQSWIKVPIPSAENPELSGGFPLFLNLECCMSVYSFACFAFWGEFCHSDLYFPGPSG